jgi:hypothetical protein
VAAPAGDAADIVIEVYEDKCYTKSTKFNKLCKDINAKGLNIRRYNY